MNTCRFCNKSEYDNHSLVKYGARHYAHHRCYLAAGKPLSELRDWQIVKFPFLLLQEFDLLQEAMQASNREREKGRIGRPPHTPAPWAPRKPFYPGVTESEVQS